MFFKGNYKTKQVGQYNVINDILYTWYGKCCAAPFGIMLQEGALKIKEMLNDNSLDDFVASNGWLEEWKAQYGIRETRLSREADDVSITTVKSWIERIPELTKGCVLSEYGLLFKLLPDKGLIEKGKSMKGSE